MTRAEIKQHLEAALAAFDAAWEQPSTAGLTSVLADLLAATKGILSHRNTLTGPGRNNRS